MTTPTELVLSKLDRPKKTSNGWSARCPAHEDRRASLSIGVGDDGRALVKCHAGCRPQAIVEALGLSLADLMSADDRAGRRPDGSRKGRQRPQGRDTAARAAKVYPTAEAAVEALQRKLGPPSAQWEYHDARGDVVGLVLRWDTPDGKTIRPVALTPEGYEAAIRMFADCLRNVGAPAELVEVFRTAEVRFEPAGNGPDDGPSWPVEPSAATWDNRPQCGSLEAWESLAGTWRCLRCEPPTAALRMAESAARIRAKHGKPEPPGGVAFRAGLKRRLAPQT